MSTEAAVCLWEACLENTFQHYTRFRDQHGAAETRSRVITFAKQCEAAWKVAHEKLGFDDPFDWEWCPRFLRVAVSEDFTLKFKYAEAAALAVMKGYPL